MHADFVGTWSQNKIIVHLSVGRLEFVFFIPRE